VTIVVPTGKMLPAGTPLRETLTLPELSFAVATPRVASLISKPQEVAPTPVPRFRLAGALIVGATVSLIAIETVAAALVSAGAAPSPVSVTVNWKVSAPLKLLAGW